MNRHISETEHEIRNSGLVDLRDHLLMVILSEFKKILEHKERGYNVYQMDTGNVFWNTGNLEWRDIVNNSQISLLLSRSLSEIHGGQKIKVGEFQREVYDDMCGNKRTVEGIIEVDLS